MPPRQFAAAPRRAVPQAPRTCAAAPRPKRLAPAALPPQKAHLKVRTSIGAIVMVCPLPLGAAGMVG